MSRAANVEPQTDGQKLMSVKREPIEYADASPEVRAVYDDIMENLKVRYVITYRSSSGNENGIHVVRVDLIDPKTGQPLKIVDANGKPVLANAIVSKSYTASH